MEEIVVEDYAALRSTLDHVVLDVREAWEYEFCHLPDSRLIPLDELAHRADELDPAEMLVVVCHHGIRSRTAQAWLLAQGFARVVSREVVVSTLKSRRNADLKTTRLSSSSSI